MPLTSWRAEDSHCEQGPNPAHNGSHSQTGEPKTGVMSRVQMHLTTEATHILESQGKVSSAGSKFSSPQKVLTSWRAKERCHQQGPNPAHHTSHSPTGEPGTGIVSRGQIQLTMEATHFLESRGGVVSRVQIQLTTGATHFLESQGWVL